MRMLRVRTQGMIWTCLLDFLSCIAFRRRRCKKVLWWIYDSYSEADVIWLDATFDRCCLDIISVCE